MPLLIKPTALQLYTHKINKIAKNIQVVKPDKK